MSLRISSAVLLLTALAACSSQSTPSGEAATTSASTAAGGGSAAGLAASVPCALAAAREYKASCSVERSSSDGRTVLTLRHPDGGFRRVIELDGGRRFAAADGAHEVAQQANGQEIEVTIADDHYLLPAPGAAGQ